MSDLSLSGFLQKSISYDEFRKRFEKTVEDIKIGVFQHAYAEYYQLNWQRSQRNEKTFQLIDSLAKQLMLIEKPITWLVITEAWCGDSAQSLAGLHHIAEASNGKINLKIFYRDEDTTLIDAFLTNGGRSIPKLIQLDERLQVTGTWGPRPKAAQELVERLKSDPATAANYSEGLHKWYASDRMHSLQEEIVTLLKS